MCAQAEIHYFIDGTSEGGAVLKFPNRKLCAKGQNKTNLLAGDLVFISGNKLLLYYIRRIYIFFF